MKCRTCGNDLQGNEYNCPFCGSCVDYTQAVEQAKAGREEGFTFLYENTYRNKLYIAMKYMKNEQDALDAVHDAMDVLQDAYIKAFARLDSLQDANAFPGWMSTIVAHTALNALQKKQAVLFSDHLEKQERQHLLMVDRHLVDHLPSVLLSCQMQEHHHRQQSR